MAVSRVGSAQASATTVTLPAHQVGDLIIIWAYNSTNSTVPTIPSSPAYTAVAAGVAGTSSGSVAGYRIATSSSETSGTWTSATRLIVHVYRGAAIGATANAQASVSTTINYPALTLQDAGGTSWVAGFGAHKTSANVEIAPTGMTNVISNATAAPEAAGHDTNAGVTSWSATTVNVVTSGAYFARTVEIKQAAGGAANVTGAQTLGATTQSATATSPIPGISGAQTTSATTQTSSVTLTPVSGGSWTPLNLTGTKALYTAKDAASFDGLTWKDQTSNHYDLVAAGGPTFDANAFGTGEPGVILDGVDDRFSVSGVSTNTDKIWCFARVQTDSQPPNNARIASLTVPGGFRDFDATACTLLSYFGSPPFDQVRSMREGVPTGTTTNDTDRVVYGVSAIYGVIYNGTNSIGYLRDAAEISAASSGIFGPTNFLTLSSAEPASFINGANMRMMALAFGVGDLTGAEITQIVGWLDNPVMGAVGPTSINITGAQTLQATTQSATANTPIAATGAQTLASLGFSATANVIGKVTGVQTTQATTQSATATAPLPANVTSAQTTRATTQVFSASLNAPARVVSGNQTTSATTQSTTVTSRVAITGAQTLQAATQSATSSVRSTITGAQATRATSQSSSITVLPAPATSHLFVNHNGAWKPATTWVNHAGTWKRPAHIFVNDAGVWKEVA